MLWRPPRSFFSSCKTMVASFGSDHHQRQAACGPGVPRIWPAGHRQLPRRNVRHGSGPDSVVVGASRAERQTVLWVFPESQGGTDRSDQPASSDRPDGGCSGADGVKDAPVTGASCCCCSLLLGVVGACHMTRVCLSYCWLQQLGRRSGDLSLLCRSRITAGTVMNQSGLFLPR